MAPNSADDRTEFSFRTRQKAWEELKKNQDTRRNVVIIGGGIVGAGILRELSLHGVSEVYLVEKNDFASGTSGASSKLIHAGIRYLEQSWEKLKGGRWQDAWQNFLFVLEASRERKILGRIAPHLVKPKSICLVIGEANSRSPLSVLAGVLFYYLIQLLQGQIFPPPRVVFRKDALKWVVPELDFKKVKAVFTFWDSETDDARLVIENLQDAHLRGAEALNYVEVRGYKKDTDGFSVRLRNKTAGDEITIPTKVLINASGPFVDEIRAREEGARPSRPLLDRVAGAHIDVYPALTNNSYYVTATDDRLVFLLKREEDGVVYTRIGTTERPLRAEEDSDRPQATEEEVAYLKSLTADFFPAIDWREAGVVRIDSGIRPLRRQESDSSFQKSREHEIIREGNLYHVVGVKLTDFRRVAAELFQLISLNELKIPYEWAALDLSENTPLRKGDRTSLYAESTVEETVRYTMPLYWEDYVERRRGLAPRLLNEAERSRLKMEFERLLSA